MNARDHAKPVHSLWHDLRLPPNLLSLSRVVIAPLIGLALAAAEPAGSVVALALLVVAGITDGLDGILARRYHQISNLGLILDPIADKLLAACTVLFLVIYRELPGWLALVIVGRDVLIIAAGALLLRGRKLTLPSNITGKYAFFAIILLIGSAIVRFPFGISLYSVVVVAFIGLSMVQYTRVFVTVRSGNTVRPFNDTPALRRLRLSAMVAVLAWTGLELLSFLDWFPG